MKIRWIILILIVAIVISIVGGCSYIPNTLNTNTNYIQENNIEVVQQDTNINNVIEDNVTMEEENEIDISKIVSMYTTTGVNLRKGPSLEDEIIKVLPINTEIKVYQTEDEWTKVIDEENIYYIYSDYISTSKTEIPKPKVTSRGGNTNLRNVEQKSNSNILTKSKGVNYFNGHKETWYSQKVLPGGGLNIPGRHVAADGTIRDEDNYICVASSDYPKGTIVETSLGTGKVYDTGCASGVIDIYTNWD